MNEVATKGSDTLWSAISQMPAGVQVALLVMMAATAMTTYLSFYLLKDAKQQREIARQEAAATRDALEKVTVALAIVQERLPR